MNYNKFKKLTYNTLELMSDLTPYNFNSENAIELICMIAAHQSRQFKRRKQVGADKPALGLTQIELSTFRTVQEHCDKYQLVIDKLGLDKSFNNIEKSDFLCIVITRLRLSMDTRPLPSAGDLMAMSEYCKEFWNTKLGEATPEKYLNDYLLAKNGV